MDYFIGIDVSKKTLDVAVLTEGEILLEERIDNRPLAIKAFFKALQQRDIPLDSIVVCMEHTGVYNVHMLEVCWKKKIRICLEAAIKIKQSQGLVRGKTDKMDALRIAQYAFRNRQELILWRPQRLSIQRLKSLLSLRDRLIRTRVQLEVPIKELVGFVDGKIIKDLNPVTRRLVNAAKKEITKVDNQIKELISEDSSLATQVQRITSIPGVGPITALNMIITTDEFTRIKEAKKFACYAGVAPFEHRSGSSIRGRTRVSKNANMAMKTLLHMAAMSAIGCCPELKAFYQRKTAAGKNKMSVLNAVRNKLISRVFACVSQGRTFQKNYTNALA
jgi:transposase